MRSRIAIATLALLAAAALPAAASYVASGPADDSIWGSGTTQSEPAATTPAPEPAEDAEPGVSIPGDSIWG
ncbi:hypothetical protein [Streptomyces sp. NPDC101145]|uniref:hypothetical protein n=1 Tax=Streptomyces sp. NPDC101145 TaxID=3366112 RepID=UPI00381602DC